MAVYTEVSDDQLRAFLDRYEIGRMVSYKGIAEGVENSNFLLITDQGPFILTLYERRVAENDLPFFLGLMEHLAERGLTCPLPVHQKTREVIGTLAGRPAAIITFLEGAWPRRPSADHCRAVGEAMARMHKASADFAMTRPNTLGPNDWRPLWTACLEGGDAGPIENARGEVETILDRINAEWPFGLQSGVIHADLFPDNVFFLGEELSGLIDFYFACNDLLAYDVAIGLNAWCFEPDCAFNLTKGQAFLAGYQSVRPLPQAERDALPMLALGAATRFMLTRLYDWINTPDGAQVTKKDPKEYLRKMRFHQSVTDAREYGLPVA